MLRRRRLVQPERQRHITDRALVSPQQGEDGAPVGFGDGVEGVGRGSGSGHGLIIFRYRKVSSGRSQTESSS